MSLFKRGINKLINKLWWFSAKSLKCKYDVSLCSIQKNICIYFILYLYYIVLLCKSALDESTVCSWVSLLFDITWYMEDTLSTVFHYIFVSKAISLLCFSFFLVFSTDLLYWCFSSFLLYSFSSQCKLLSAKSLKCKCMRHLMSASNKMQKHGRRLKPGSTEDHPSSESQHFISFALLFYLRCDCEISHINKSNCNASKVKIRGGN